MSCVEDIWGKSSLFNGNDDVHDYETLYGLKWWLCCLVALTEYRARLSLVVTWLGARSAGCTSRPGTIAYRGITRLLINGSLP